MLSLQITRTARPKPRVADPDLGFGQVFTDHMLVMDCTQGIGWHDARIEPYGPLRLDPAALVLHYGQAVFDGFKAFRSSTGDGGPVRLDAADIALSVADRIPTLHAAFSFGWPCAGAGGRRSR